MVPRRLSEVPAPRREWLKATQRLWQAFWSSEVAVLLTPTDRAALERQHDLYDERERAYRGFRKERFVSGSKGQPVLNPLGSLITRLDA